AKQAIQEAVSSPLIDASIEGARGILFNITGGPDLTIKEVEETAKLVAQTAGGDANIIFGAAIDEAFKDSLKITIIATGFDTVRKTLSGLIKRPSQPVFSGEKKKKDKDQAEKKVKINLTEGEIDEKILANLPKNLPEGVKIEDELDVPSFLRRGNN
ncbi:hypothetical protein J7J95_03230, partial [bacterium]|nr:hypothetical protein [bacterium]